MLREYREALAAAGMSDEAGRADEWLARLK